jgi:RNA polymerase sigma-70 factor (ECF subfamily)
LRRTSASTRSRAGSAGRGRWISVLRRSRCSRTSPSCRRSPGSRRSRPRTSSRSSARRCGSPPKQRAALILCEVLKWQATEAAELLETSVASVNSALQRARATLATSDTVAPAELDADTLALLERYVAAFEAYDIDRLTELLHEDAVQSMPPYSLWLRGRDDIFTWWLGPGIGCKGSKLVPVGLVNGMPAWGQYKPDPDGGYEPWSVIVPEVSDGRIAELTFFLDTQRLFPVYGLADHLD